MLLLLDKLLVYDLFFLGGRDLDLDLDLDLE